MTKEDFETMLEQHANIEHQPVYDETLQNMTGIALRNINLSWYQENEERATVITKEKFKTMTPDEVLMAVNKGVDVVGVTRVTGYYGKTNSFNPGKIGELHDRTRQGEYFS